MNPPVNPTLVTTDAPFEESATRSSSRTGCPPRNRTVSRRFVALLIGMGGALVGCGSDQHLVGESSLNGGQGAAGAAPGEQLASRPLVISAREAVRRLAVVLWNQADDPALIAEADAGKIRNTADVRATALRMLRDPRARVGVARFYRQWLEQHRVGELRKDTTIFPEFTPALRTDMVPEGELLGVHITLDIDGRFPTLFTAPFSFVTARTATLYGLSGVVGDEHQRVAFDPAQRAGVLTLPGVLALTSSETRTLPVRRAMFVMRQFLCTELPPPPQNEPPLMYEPTRGTTRSQLEASLADKAHCQGCHQLFNPIGFALEGFDPLGRLRTVENGHPVDTTANVNQGGGNLLDGWVTGAANLGKKLSTAPAAADCFVEQWLTFALGRRIIAQDRLEMRDLADQFVRLDFNLQGLIADVLQSDVFLARETMR